MTLYNDLLRHTRALFHGVLPYLELLDAFPGEGPGRRENSNGRDAMALPREADVRHLAVVAFHPIDRWKQKSHNRPMIALMLPGCSSSIQNGMIRPA